ncbi:interleukin-22 receptor subunit alpha-2 [Microcaecilia unicolor]|uniref:Interleukin-22 receptor subunit alpha-2 n=1 Tax=Microcaecilia unicolor TaxID=1415580 RepID=A0A6P7XEQ1_9AMPH|nr:interleukin-22 receptor subunit alpha-2 [Microcaecilia unicolor]
MASGRPDSIAEFWHNPVIGAPHMYMPTHTEAIELTQLQSRKHDMEACTSKIGLPAQIKNLKFYSTDLRTVLQWDPVNGTAAVYFIQFKIYGDPEWQNKTDCWGMPETFCDLTPEFSKLENVYEQHFAQVQAETAGGLSSWIETGAFCPNDDKNNDPPTLELTPQLHGISVHIIPSVATQQDMYGMASKASRKKLKYIITLSSTTESQKTYVANENVWNISNLTPGERYCISVKTKLEHIDKISQPSKEQCIKLQVNSKEEESSRSSKHAHFPTAANLCGDLSSFRTSTQTNLII